MDWISQEAEQQYAAVVRSADRLLVGLDFDGTLSPIVDDPTEAHIHPDAGRGGLGRKLFAESLAAAKAAGLQHIDATIGADNEAGLAYYAAMGFVPYRDGDGAIPHRFDL